MAETGVLKSGAASGRGRDTLKARSRSLGGMLRRIRRPLAIAVAIIVALPIVLTPLYAFVNPPFGTIMLLQALGGTGIHKRWVELDAVSPRAVRAVMASEDARFCSHHGIDWIEVHKALDDNDGPHRGASTITMQVARNLFLWGARTWVRKAVEAPLALYIDFVLPKRRIMEIYLNVAQWGTGVYGIAEESERSFGIPPSQLSASQGALIAATLPSPDWRDPAKPGPGMQRIARRIAARAARLGDADHCLPK